MSGTRPAQRSLRQPGVRDAAVNLMTRTSLGHVRPRGGVAAVIRRRDPPTGYGADLPVDRSILEEQEAADRAYAEEYRDARDERRRSPSWLASSRWSCPCRSWPRRATRAWPRSSDPFMRWASEFAGARCAARAAMALLDRYARPVVRAAGDDRRDHGLGGRAISTPVPGRLSATTSADMNTLVAVGTGAAFVFSVVATVAPSFFVARGVAPDTYYEAVIFIIALILVGNALEARAKRQTAAALRGLAELQPKTARIERDGGEVRRARRGR